MLPASGVGQVEQGRVFLGQKLQLCADSPGWGQPIHLDTATAPQLALPAHTNQLQPSWATPLCAFPLPMVLLALSLLLPGFCPNLHSWGGGGLLILSLSSGLTNLDPLLPSNVPS